MLCVSRRWIHQVFPAQSSQEKGKKYLIHNVVASHVRVELQKATSVSTKEPFTTCSNAKFSYLFGEKFRWMVTTFCARKKQECSLTTLSLGRTEAGNWVPILMNKPRFPCLPFFGGATEGCSRSGACKVRANLPERLVHRLIEPLCPLPETADFDENGENGEFAFYTK